MTITFLGTGSIIPDPKQENILLRSYSAIFVKLENNETFLFDIGPGTLSKMQQQGIDSRKQPDNLCISHFHIDHCEDYIGAIKGRWFEPKTGVLSPQKPIHVYGPKHLNQFTQELCGNVERWSYMNTMLNYKKVITLHELKDWDTVKNNNWSLTTAPVKHYDGVAFRLEAEGKSFVYSGDMGYDENLATLGKNADVVAIECSFPDNSKLLGAHLCPEDVGKLAKLGNFKKTILTHLYPTCNGKEEVMKEKIQSIFQTTVQVAYDTYTITL